MARVAVVTGGASGIGKAVVMRLLGEDWQVVALDRSADGLDELRPAVGNASDRLTTLVCDIADEADVVATFGVIDQAFPHLNALVSSAGILKIGRLEDMSSEAFDALFAVNVRGLWLAARSAMPMLKIAAGGGELARIVNLASIAGLRHKINSGAYAGTKAAVIALTKVMAVEMAESGVLVNAVAPATVDTPMVAPHRIPGANTGYRTSGTSPLGRIAQPEDVAAVINFLLSKDAGYVTGTVVPVDGGTIAAFVPQ